LREGVNSSIRSSGSVNAHTFAADAFKRSLKVILNRVAMGLALPACKRSAVVGDDYIQPPRHPKSSRHLSGVRDVLTSIEISLQYHLSRDLIDIIAGSVRLFAGFMQRLVRGNCRQSLIPSDDWAGKNRPQFFDEAQSFGCGGAYLAAQLPRDSHDNVIDFPFANNLCDSRRRSLVRCDRLEGMRQQLQLIGDCRADAHAAKIDR
jgi:hypothetical protein